MILRNHGLLSWDGSVPQAFAVLWTLQRSCEIQVAGAALGPSIPIPEAIQRKASADAGARWAVCRATASSEAAYLRRPSP